MDRRADRLGRGELIVTADARLGARFLQHPPAKVSARVPLHQLKRLVEVSPANHGAANRADLVNGWQTLPAGRATHDTQRALDKAQRMPLGGRLGIALCLRFWGGRLGLRGWLRSGVVGHGGGRSADRILSVLSGFLGGPKQRKWSETWAVKCPKAPNGHQAGISIEKLTF